MESLSLVVLRSIEAHESTRPEGPTMDELAADLGIPAAFGRRRLGERLHRQVVLGRVHSDGERFRLTAAGRRAASAPSE
jgi:hypothetical protein